MAIYDINTIQGDVNTSYGDEYIKQALANLGQRQGLKGDAIQTQTFKITDVIFDAENKIVPHTYIKGYYDAKTDEIIYTADTDDISTPLFVYKLSDSIDGLELNNLYSLSSENVNLAPKYVECKITKNQSTNSYYFIGKGMDGAEIANIVVLEFSEFGVNLLDGLYFEPVESNKIVMMHYANSTQIECSNVSLSDIYSTLLAYDSIEQIITYYINNIVTTDTNPNNDSTVIIEENNGNISTVFSYLASILIPEVKTLYNDSIYKVDGNKYAGLKRRILYELIKYVYEEFNKIDAKTDTSINVYFDKDFYISYLANTNTDVIYISYDIPFRGRGIKNAKIEPPFDYRNNANMFLADILTDEDRYTSYKFYVNYIDDDKYVDSITIDQTAILPYIGKNDALTDVWYINGEQTNVHATGADAGNPNIMFVSYTLNTSADNTDRVIDIDVLHTYTDDNVTLEKINNAFDKEPIIHTFYYDLGNSVNVANSIDKNYEFSIPLPDPNKLVKNAGFENFIKNVLVFAIIDVKISSTVIDDDTLYSLISGNGPASYITVFFHINKTYKGEYIWEPILNPLYNSETTTVSSSSAAPVLDLAAMTSLKQLMNYYVQITFKPDVYYHRWVVFTSTNEVLKNTNKNINADAKYPVIKVDTGEEYYGTASFNTLNFTPKFVLERNVIEDNGRIDSVNDYSKDNASFTISRDKTISDITGVEKVNADTNPIQNEWIPNAKLDQNQKINDSYPMLDLREVFVNNQTLLNRLSIITTGPSGNQGDERYPIYHAYIGHRYTDGADGLRSLVIGTSSNVYNMQNSTTMGREITDTNGTYNSWQQFQTFNNLTIALPLIVETDAEFKRNVKLSNVDGNSSFNVKSKTVRFDNKSAGATFDVETPSIKFTQEVDNYISLLTNKISIISPNLELNNEQGKVTIKSSDFNVNSVNNINIQTEGDLLISTDTTASISTKHGLSLVNTEVDNSYQKVELNDQSIKLHLKTSTNQTTYEVTPDSILLPTGKTTSIYGGDNNKDNFIKYNENNLEISSKNLILGDDDTTITTNAKDVVINSDAVFNNKFVAEGEFEVNSNIINLGDAAAPADITINAKNTEFNTGDTKFKGNLRVSGNVTATNVTVNGLLVTETSSVTSVLTHKDGTTWDYVYGPTYDNVGGEFVQKMFLFGLTTIDLNYVFDPKFVPESNTNNDIYNKDFITVTDHFVNGYKVDGSGSPKQNTRNFMTTGDYVYSDINLNLTAFLNAHSEDSMFARGELRRNNGDVLVTKISDVIIPLSNPTLYNIDKLINKKDVGDGQKSYVNIPTEHRLKTFLLFIERFAYFANPREDYSIKDVYILRQAKEISMAMDNFNPDMINHICTLNPTTEQLKNELNAQL